MPTRGFVVNSYGEIANGQLTSTPTYPDVTLGVEAVAAVVPYVDANLGISAGAKIIMFNANVNGGLPSAYVTATTVADITTAWNAT